MTGRVHPAFCAALLFLIAIPVEAQQPSANEAAVRQIVSSIYAGYSKPFDVLWPEPREGAEPTGNENSPPGDAVDGYDIRYSKDMASLIASWEKVLGDELYNMNGFDWYCQCQDFDPAQAKLTSQNYVSRGSDRMDARLRFAPVGGKGAPITLRFIRDNADWAIDDIIFEGGGSARKLLAEDMRDAAKAAQ